MNAVNLNLETFQNFGADPVDTTRTFTETVACLGIFRLFRTCFCETPLKVSASTRVVPIYRRQGL